jgi:antitoxin (DNA-binding transcriptional repressor) of toxin-antitoxin stability system
MQKQIEINNLNTQLSSVLKNVESGEEYIVIKNKKAVAKIVALTSEELEEFNAGHGGEKWTEDDFDINLSDE